MKLILSSLQKERGLCLISYYTQCGIKQNCVRRWYSYRASTSDCATMILKILSSAAEVGMTSIIWKVFIELNKNFDFFFFNIIYLSSALWTTGGHTSFLYCMPFFFYNLSKHILKIFCPKQGFLPLQKPMKFFSDL